MGNARTCASISVCGPELKLKAICSAARGEAKEASPSKVRQDVIHLHGNMMVQVEPALLSSCYKYGYVVVSIRRGSQHRS